MKNIAVFGSTGSIGRNTLNVARKFPDKLRVIALAANSDVKTLLKQAEEFHPRFICLGDKKSALKLKGSLRPKIKVLCEEDGLIELAKEKAVDQCVFAISGSAALKPLLGALKCGKDIALANKEALVMAGPLIMAMARKSGSRIIPIDSEQSAIWQCLEGEDHLRLKRIYLTASGGALLNMSRPQLAKVTLSQVLRHPRWKMGKKITVDSATLMNKGLEFLEAMFLFNVGYEKITVLIHPQALVHSMVEFIDGVIIAQISATDMRIPIQYALTYPQRLKSDVAALDFYKLRELTFSKPDTLKFPCLRLAFQAARELGTLPAVMNAANEAAAEGFIKGKSAFAEIPKVVEKVMRRHRNKPGYLVTDILAADAWARQEAGKLLC